MKNRFNAVPLINRNRSRFDLSHGLKTTANVGMLYPFEVREIYPGDTFKYNTVFVSRLTSTFFKPVMDNLFVDIHYFFVPSRLVMDEFPAVFGENNNSEWADTQPTDCPFITNVTFPEGSVADYLGLPTKMSIGNNRVNILPFRAFAKIWNEWFRDENVQKPVNIFKANYPGLYETPNSNDWSPTNYFGKLPKVAKLHDFFTSCLPAPQKGSAVNVLGPGLGVAPASVAPSAYNTSNVGTIWGYVDGAQAVMPSYTNLALKNIPNTNTGFEVSESQGSAPSYNQYPLNPLNLFTNTPLSVNDLRYAIAVQQMLELDARGGTRYVEYLNAHFGVQAGDYRLQRSEYLGGRRVPINITQVVQSTGGGSTGDQALGAVGGYSLSDGRARMTKSFVEHGYLFGVYCIRQFHTYQQGIDKMWSRISRADFYDPVYANIGEQPVYRRELYGAEDTDSVFGYQEAWADLRFAQSKITGQIRYNASNTLSLWAFGDLYANAPTLTPTFIEETPDLVDQTISVQSNTQDQFIFDFYLNVEAYRVLPVWSIPKLR